MRKFAGKKQSDARGDWLPWRVFLEIQGLGPFSSSVLGSIAQNETKSHSGQARRWQRMVGGISGHL